MNINSIDLRQLRYFITVAEELNFSRAAERLHISQPPLSYAIQQLEAGLNAKLFNRTKRKVELTEAGSYLMKAAGRLMRDTHETLVYTQAAARGQVGELRIGINFSAPLYPRFAEIIGRYRRLYPKVRLVFREIFYEAGIKALYDENLDLCFTRPERMDAKGKICFQMFSDDYLQLCLPADHILARKKRIVIENLRHETFLLSPRQMRTPLYDELLNMAQKQGFLPRISQDTAHFPVIINLVAAGCGIAFLPQFMKTAAHGKVVFKKLGSLKPQICNQPLEIAYRHDKKSKLVENFLVLVER